MGNIFFSPNNFALQVEKHLLCILLPVCCKLQQHVAICNMSGLYMKQPFSTNIACLPLFCSRRSDNPLAALRVSIRALCFTSRFTLRVFFIRSLATIPNAWNRLLYYLRLNTINYPCPNIYLYTCSASYSMVVSAMISFLLSYSRGGSWIF